MATSSITANFEIRDPKEYLPSEASFAKQSGYSSVRAFVDGLWKAYRMKPPRRTFDYTEWRKDNLFPDETVDSLYDKIKAYSAAKGERSSATAQEVAQ